MTQQRSVVLSALLVALGCLFCTADAAKRSHNLYRGHHFEEGPSFHKQPKRGRNRRLSSDATTRIVGGSNAPSGRYPYFVYLDTEYAGFEDEVFFCGGTLIHEDIILTVGHCGVNLTYAYANVNYTQDYFDLGFSGFEHFSDIEDFATHPDFVESTRYYDLMVMKMTTPAPASYTPINYNTDPSIPEDMDPVSVMGFGLLVFNTSSAPLFLQEADVEVIDFDQCNSNAFEVYNHSINDESHICAGLPQGGVDACTGDSGGPLFVKGSSGPASDLQVGIVAFGRDCGDARYPGVYTRVSAAADWITQQVCELSNNPPPSCFTSTPEATPAPTVAPVLVTAAPVTTFPSTFSPETFAPIKPAPSGLFPVSLAPATPAPVNTDQTTIAPVTAEPTTMAPATTAPVTKEPTTMTPVTAAPVATEVPVTTAPMTTFPSTFSPETFAPIKPAPSGLFPVAPVSELPSPEPVFLACFPCGATGTTVTSFGEVEVSGFGNISCPSLQVLGEFGLISMEDCPNVVAVAQEFCECETRPTISPSPSIITSEVPSMEPTRNFYKNACFSGHNTVVTKDRGTILMNELQLGDLVLTNDKKFEQVYSFGHHHDSLPVNYMRLILKSNVLEISDDHMLFVEGNRAVPASWLKIHREVRVKMADGHFESIIKIEEIVRSGAYGPFTASGTVVVGGVVASSFVTLQDSSPVLKIGSVATPFSYQWLAHTFEAPHRLYCSLIDCSTETYDSQGISLWLSNATQWAKWMFSQDCMLLGLISALLLPAVAGFWLFSKTHVLLFAVALHVVLTGRKGMKKSA